MLHTGGGLHEAPGHQRQTARVVAADTALTWQSESTMDYCRMASIKTAWKGFPASKQSLSKEQTC